MNIKTALLFPGQGSQSANMGKELAEKNNEIMDLWKKAEKFSSLPLREIYWESNDDVLMAETVNLQPALTVTNLALLIEHINKLDPQAAAGHSLGEFSALAAAKVLSIDDVLELVSVRGKLMQDADPNKESGMCVALRLSLEELEPIVENIANESGKILKIANYNTIKQFAISGHKEAIESLSEDTKAHKAKIIPLAVSGAFHSPLMAEVNKEFSKVLEAKDWKNPIFPIYANISAEAVNEGKSMLNKMKKQMVSSVYWYQSMQAMHKIGIKHFTELGTKGVLVRMLPHILPSDEIESLQFEV